MQTTVSTSCIVNFRLTVLVAVSKLAIKQLFIGIVPSVYLLEPHKKTVSSNISNPRKNVLFGFDILYVTGISVFKSISIISPVSLDNAYKVLFSILTS